MKRPAIIIIASMFTMGMCIATPNLFAGTTWYVDDDAPSDPGPGDPAVSDPLEDGSSGHPFDAIQEGIDAALNGDTVLVLDGTYTGTGNRDIDFGGKAITVRSENGRDSCIIDCEADMGNQHRGFYFHSGEGNNSVVQGFTITNGFIYVDNFEYGGGIFCMDCSPTIMENTISDNYAFVGGAGIYCSNGFPIIRDNIISDNSIYAYGGGAGIYCSGGHPVITNNIISGNYNTQPESGGAGAGILCGNATISKNIIMGNHTWSHGGGIACSDATITDCIISGNHCEYEGGGIYCGDAQITNCFIIGNVGGIESFGGGGIDCDDTLITNCLIANNQAGSHSSPGGAGGIDCWGGTIINCTITGNSVLYLCTTGGISGSPTIINSIICYNDLAQITGSPTVSYSNIEGEYSGTGNIDANPLFISGPGGDYYLMQPVSDGLSLISPCVDSGDPLSDMIHGTTRINLIQDSGTIDMGFHYRPCIPAGHLLEEK